MQSKTLLGLLCLVLAISVACSKPASNSETAGAPPQQTTADNSAAPAAAPAAPPAAAPAEKKEAPKPPEPPKPVVIPSGTTLTIRLANGLSSKTNKPGDPF